MIRDVNANELIEAAAGKLEKMEEFRPPEWSGFVKTGVAKERPPQQPNWWWLRTASMLRKLYLGQPAGVSRMRVTYGSRKNRGHKPSHRYPASGAMIRKMLQQLDMAGFVKTEKGKGRSVTPKGQTFLNSVARELKK